MVAAQAWGVDILEAGHNQKDMRVPERKAFQTPTHGKSVTSNWLPWIHDSGYYRAGFLLLTVSRMFPSITGGRTQGMQQEYQKSI